MCESLQTAPLKNGKPLFKEYSSKLAASYFFNKEFLKKNKNNNNTKINKV